MAKQLLGMVMFAAAGSLMAAQPSSTPATGYLGNLPQVAFTLVTEDHAAGSESHEGSSRSAGHESSDKAGMDKHNDKSDSKNDKPGATGASSSDDKGGSKEVENESGDDAKGSPDKSGTHVSDTKGHDDSGVLPTPIPS